MFLDVDLEFVLGVEDIEALPFRMNSKIRCRSMLMPVSRTMWNRWSDVANW